MSSKYEASFEDVMNKARADGYSQDYATALAMMVCDLQSDDFSVRYFPTGKYFSVTGEIDAVISYEEYAEVFVNAVGIDSHQLAEIITALTNGNELPEWCYNRDLVTNIRSRLED